MTPIQHAMTSMIASALFVMIVAIVTMCMLWKDYRRRRRQMEETQRRIDALRAENARHMREREEMERRDREDAERGWAQIKTQDMVIVQKILRGEFQREYYNLVDTSDWGTLYRLKSEWWNRFVGATPPYPERGWDTIRAGMMSWDTVVEVRCPSTGTIYRLRVPRECRSARAAVAWTFRMREEMYQPAIQT